MFVHRLSPLQTGGQSSEAWRSVSKIASGQPAVVRIFLGADVTDMSPHYNLSPSWRYVADVGVYMRSVAAPAAKRRLPACSINDSLWLMFVKLDVLLSSLSSKYSLAIGFCDLLITELWLNIARGVSDRRGHYRFHYVTACHKHRLFMNIHEVCAGRKLMKPNMSDTCPVYISGKSALVGC